MGLQDDNGSRPSSHATPTTQDRKNAKNTTTSASKVFYYDLTNDDEDVIIPGSSKRKSGTTSKGSGRSGEDDYMATSAKKRKPASPRKKKDGEQRLKQIRKHAPQSYLQKLSRALEQRMFVIDRTRQGTDEVPEEVVEMAGTTGNIYHVTICKLPHCTCPDHMKGNQCKHIVYVLHNVLKAPEHLQYQVALLSSELREIFAHAPPLPSSSTSASADHPSHRKPIDGDCPICFTEMDSEATEDIVWCKAACGNNIHKICFEQWARGQTGKGVTCVYCRTPWQRDDDTIRKVKERGKIGEEGYVNVAKELGLSGSRDYSGYHQPWVRRNFEYS